MTVGRCAGLLRENASARWMAVLILMTCAATIFTVYRAYLEVEQYPGTDLRCKVIGARRLLEGKDPYYRPWQQAEPEHLRMFSRNTYTPVLLALYVPLCELQYKTQRIIYAALDEVEVSLCLLALAYILPDIRKRILVCCSFLLLTVPNFSFILHVERGQYYLLLLLLSTLAAICFLRSKFNAAMCCLCLLVLIRPTFLIALACLYLLGHRRLATKCLLVIIAVIATLLPVIKPNVWRSYFETMQEAQTFELIAVDRFPAYTMPFRPLGSTMAEGLDFSKATKDLWYRADRTLIGSAYRGAMMWRLRKLGLTSSSILERTSLTLLLLTSLAICMLAAYFARRPISHTSQLVLIFAAPTIVEAFGPQRNSYCDATILCSVMLVVIALLQRRSSRYEPAILVTAFMLAVVCPFVEIFAPGGFPEKAHGWIADIRWGVLVGGVIAYLLWQLRVPKIVYRHDTDSQALPASLSSCA